MPMEYFEQRERALLGDRFDVLYAAPQETAERGVTVSALRSSPEQFAAKADFPLEASPFCKAAFVVHQPDDLKFRPGRHPYHHAGVFYSQEPSASSAAPLLGVQPGMRVLDMCAAPGGKSSQLAAALQGRGVLVSNEYVAARADILKSNLERMGVPNAVVLNEAPARIADALPEFFDRVLVDAPCSGEGMFRKEEAAVTDWSQETVEMCARRQAEILSSAAALIRPGGHLVYSTCTFSPEEDEQAVARFLENHPEFVPETVDAPWFEAGENGNFRLWPHKLLGEGHFAAVLRKMEGSEESTVIPAGEKLPKTWQPFAGSLDIRLPDGKAVTFGDTLYWAPPDMPDIRKLKVLRPGLELGTVKKDRFEPAHALALWLKTCENQQDYPADSGEISAYLRGDVVPSTQKGWCLVSAGGYSIGWGKGDGRVLKNHYPKGLRR